MSIVKVPTDKLELIQGFELAGVPVPCREIDTFKQTDSDPPPNTEMLGRLLSTELPEETVWVTAPVDTKVKLPDAPDATLAFNLR